MDHAISQQGEFNIVGDKTKFVTGTTDTLGVKSDDEIFNEDAIITTCTHDPRISALKRVAANLFPIKSLS